MTRRLSTAGPALVACLAVAACGRPVPPAVGPSVGPAGSAGWTYPGPDGGPAVPGVDEGSASYVGQVVVWADAADAGLSTTSGPGGVTAEGQLPAADGRPVPIRLTSPDGNRGQVRIDGTGYDLADGNLFLVATRGGAVRVKQLARDLSGLLAAEKKDFRAFARADPDILAFFRDDPARPTGKRK